MAERESKSALQSSSSSRQGRPASSSGSLRGSFKPAAIPQSLLKYSSSLERKRTFRQDVSKSLARSGGGLRTSITISEIGVLQSVMIKEDDDSSHDEQAHDTHAATTSSPPHNSTTITTTSQSSSNNSRATRDRFMASVMSKSTLLEPNELAFLQKLATADQGAINNEHLERAMHVLENDPLYQSSSTTKQQEQKSDDKAQQVRASLRVSICRRVEEEEEEVSESQTQQEQEQPKPPRDHSFRKELWNEYWESWSSRQKLVSQALTCPAANNKDGDTEKDKHHHHHHGKKKNGVVKFFQKVFFIPHSDSEEEEGDEDDTVLENDIVEEAPFSVLGATRDDETMLSMMVLSPPNMDALRPNLPYACQQDNFWLKYSMIRDVSNHETAEYKIDLSSRPWFLLTHTTLFLSCRRSTNREHLSKCYFAVFVVRRELFLPLKPWMGMFWAALLALPGA